MKTNLFTLFDLLEKKNSYLMEFYKLNVQELTKMSQGSSTNLEDFYYSRELLLNAVEKIDKKLQKEYLEAVETTVLEKKKLEKLFNFKDQVLASILEQDLVILDFVQRREKKLLDEAA